MYRNRRPRKPFGDSSKAVKTAYDLEIGDHIFLAIVCQDDARYVQEQIVASAPILYADHKDNNGFGSTLLDQLVIDLLYTKKDSEYLSTRPIMHFTSDMGLEGRYDNGHKVFRTRKDAEVYLGIYKEEVTVDTPAEVTIGEVLTLIDEAFLTGMTVAASIAQAEANKRFALSSRENENYTKSGKSDETYHRNAMAQAHKAITAMNIAEKIKKLASQTIPSSYAPQLSEFRKTA